MIGGEDYNLPKEAFEQVYIPNGFVDIVKASFVMNSETIHGNKMIGFESPVCTEVDSVEEFDFIQNRSQEESEDIKYSRMLDADINFTL